MPFDVVKEFNVSKMPTIQVIRNGEVRKVYICNEDAATAVDKVRQYIQDEVNATAA